MIHTEVWNSIINWILWRSISKVISCKFLTSLTLSVDLVLLRSKDFLINSEVWYEVINWVSLWRIEGSY